jgi:hypothetical protein
MRSGEILTLQFGHQANFVGTHFWNIQAETDDRDINKDVLFRSRDEGKSYTPRVLLFDLKGSLGRLGTSSFSNRTTFNFFSPSQSSSGPNNIQTWHGSISTHSQEQPKLEFQEYIQSQKFQSQSNSKKTKDKNQGINGIGKEQDNLRQEKIMKRKQMENQIQVWSDFLTTTFHTKSIYEIESFKYEIDGFDFWTNGAQIFASTDGGEGGANGAVGTYFQEKSEILDRLRFFLEECDHLTGVQSFCDTDNGFGGFAKGLLQNFRDDCPKLPVVTFGMSSAHLRPKQQRGEHELDRNLLNRALTWHALACGGHRLSNLFSPLQPHLWRPNPLLHFQLSNNYHTSAIMAGAIDSATLPWRLLEGSEISGVMWDLGVGGQMPVSSLSLAFPLLIPRELNLWNVLLASRPLPAAAFALCLSFANVRPDDPMGEVVTLRGVRPVEEARNVLSQYLNRYACRHRQRLFSDFFSFHASGP